MDPGYTLLQHIKTVPNLINEDPSITTPKNSSFMDMPWSEFSKLLNNKRRSSASASSTSSQSSSDETPENFSLGNWDSMTGYQDSEHRTTL
ncbi:uncharacterized protein EV154DRAFT_530227 [Mucor mucedo]|uniref:uncharacterized protein n=1 Tax=Mucor mucedo TaxID=29922 RepID=UPI0022209DD0|nr:uncharacterized protein EV154DRAFT_530227 [Mucor mucedo]KAI7870095.1 hypothetical protein EV154DRAFT_530227 [Mucor mucedo]